MESIQKDAKILIELTKEEALVLHDWLFRFNESEKVDLILDQAEQLILWDMEACLEREVSETFQDNYEALLKVARDSLVNTTVQMKHKLSYSFDDVSVSKFCYDLKRKVIQVYFDDFFDLQIEDYMGIPCIWTIQNWKEAKCRIEVDTKFYRIEERMGIFDSILYMHYNENDQFEMFVSTVDGRYITFYFEGAELSLES